MIKYNFAIFILTHGRANNVITYDTLLKCGYSGKVYIIIDNEDKQVDKYKELYGDKVIVFDKLKISEEFDTADNFDNRKAIVYARNACFNIAKDLGLDYFLELDDDYTDFMHRFIENGKLGFKSTKNLDTVCNAFLEFLENTPTDSIAFAQGGDFIGGKDNDRFNKGLIRKCMNSFFCSTKKPFTFLGRVNEDVNTYTRLAQIGKLFFTYTKFMLNQKQTQSNKGGMTELYLDSGTYLKSFYSVMYSPSCVYVGEMGGSHKRIHHKIMWKNCTPLIINEKWKKR